MSAVSWTTRRDKQKFGDTREKTHNIGLRFIMRAPTLPFNELRFVIRFPLTYGHYILQAYNKVARQRKKYPANIAKGNDIWYFDNKVLANIQWFDIRCVDCSIIGRVLIAKC